MQQHVSGARRVGRRKIADNAVECEQRLGQIAFEEAVENIAFALGSKFMENADLVGRHADQVSAQAGQARQAANTAAGSGRGLQDPFADQRDDSVQFFMVAVVGRAVGRHMPGDIRSRQAITPGQQIGAMTRQEIVLLAQHDLQPMPLKLHVLDDLGIEQRDGVAGCRVFEPRMEFVGDGCPANLVGGLEDGDLQAFPGQIMGASQAIVAGSNNQNVMHQRINTNSSDMVGWRAIVASKSAFLRPALTAIAAAWRISGASGPIMWIPTTRSVAPSTTSL